MSDTLISGNGQFSLVMQDDGNLVLYQAGRGPIWASNTSDPGPLPPDPPVPPPARTGRVHFDGRSQADDQGAFTPLGTSLFWAIRDIGTSHLQDNLQWARAHGVDFVRILCDTCDWPSELRTDPRTPDFPSKLQFTLQLCEQLGLRVALTLFGSNALTPEDQGRTVDIVLQAVNARPSVIQYIELSNEGLGFRDGMGTARMRVFAGKFRTAGFPTALTSIAHHEEMYRDPQIADVATEHFDRATTENGWRPVRQPWGFWEYPQSPGRFINNEPVGIGSSVAQETDPLHLAFGWLITFIASGSAHVVHTGAGIYGVPMTHPTAGPRPANLWEQPTLEPTFQMIGTLRSSLAGDLASWSRQNHHWVDHPFAFQPFTVGDEALAQNKGCVRAYAAISGSSFVCAPIGIMQTLQLTPKKPMQWGVIDPLSGSVMQNGTGVISLGPSPEAVLIIGSHT